MDLPYVVTRLDTIGKVERAGFRYVGDAIGFVRMMVVLECNLCEWKVVNRETNRVCCIAKYDAGEVTYR